jgi:hypothetical protein
MLFETHLYCAIICHSSDGLNEIIILKNCLCYEMISLFFVNFPLGCFNFNVSMFAM